MSQKNTVSELESSSPPKRLKLIAFFSQDDTTLLHKFVLDNSPPKLSGHAIAAHLRAMSQDLPVNYLNEEGLSPLHLAILKKNPFMVEMLCSCIVNLNINAPTANRKTPIQLAVLSVHFEIVEILLNKGADINECLLYAAKMDRWAIVKELLPRGQFVTILDSQKRSLLHWAAERGNLNIVMQLLSLGCEVDAKDLCRKTPLHLAVERKHWEVAKELMSRNASVSIADGCGMYPLHWAAKYGNLDIVKQLIRHGCYISAKDGRGHTALYLSASSNHREVFEHLLTKISNNENKTLLHCSAMCGSLTGIKKSLLLGCDIDATDLCRKTPLQLAVEGKHWEVAEELMSRNASVNVTDTCGRYPLHWAAEYGNLDIVKQLIRHGCFIDMKNKWGETSLYLSAVFRHREVFEHLLTKTNDISNKKQTLLHCSAMCGSLTGVRKSLLLGCDIDAKDCFGSTALRLAVEGKHWEVAEELLSRNASVNVANGCDRKYPLHFAAEFGNLDIVNQIILHGCKIDTKDMSGNTALYLSAKSDHREVFEHLITKTRDISNNQNRTLLHCSAMCGSRDGIKMSLLECDIDAKDLCDCTALHLATERKHWKLVKGLLSRNASVNIVDTIKKRSPLHWAAKHGNLDIVQQILHRGHCEVDAKDIKGNTALDLAVSEGHVEIVQLLSNHQSVTDNNNDE